MVLLHVRQDRLHGFLHGEHLFAELGSQLLHGLDLGVIAGEAVLLHGVQDQLLQAVLSQLLAQMLHGQVLELHVQIVAVLLDEVGQLVAHGAQDGNSHVAGAVLARFNIQPDGAVRVLAAHGAVAAVRVLGREPDDIHAHGLGNPIDSGDMRLQLAADFDSLDPGRVDPCLPALDALLLGKLHGLLQTLLACLDLGVLPKGLSQPVGLPHGLLVQSEHPRILLHGLLHGDGMGDTLIDGAHVPGNPPVGILGTVTQIRGKIALEYHVGQSTQLGRVDGVDGVLHVGVCGLQLLHLDLGAVFQDNTAAV